MFPVTVILAPFLIIKDLFCGTLRSARVVSFEMTIGAKNWLIAKYARTAMATATLILGNIYSPRPRSEGKLTSMDTLSSSPWPLASLYSTSKIPGWGMAGILEVEYKD